MMNSDVDLPPFPEVPKLGAALYYRTQPTRRTAVARQHQKALATAARVALADRVYALWQLAGGQAQ